MQAHPIAVNPTQDVASHAHASRLANLYRAQADGDCRVAEIEDEINRHQHLIAAAGHAAPNNLNEAEALVSKLGA
ncbi:MAG: hypothetical protein ABIT70_10845, partial [Sulfuriferula sp.]